MAGHRNWKDIKREGNKEGTARARDELQAELDRHGGPLADIRRRRSLTQVDVAGELGVSQAQISRIEVGNDLLVSTLARYVDAIGGELELVAKFSDQELVIDVKGNTPLAGLNTPATGKPKPVRSKDKRGGSRSPTVPTAKK